MLITKTFMYRGKEVSYDELKNHSVMPIQVQCDKCGIQFQTTKYQLVRNGHQLCRKCALSSKLAKPIPEGMVFGRLTVIGQGHQPGTSLCKCECGNIREFKNSALKSGQTSSCGCLRSDNAKRIAEQYLSQYQQGDRNWNWKGGISPQRNCIERTAEYKTMRKTVLERCGSQCAKCGSSKDLCVHHICNFVDYPELQLDADNCACLCRTCHQNFHHKYGLSNTTREQFNEFINS